MVARLTWRDSRSHIHERFRHILITPIRNGGRPARPTKIPAAINNSKLRRPTRPQHGKKFGRNASLRKINNKAGAEIAKTKLLGNLLDVLA